MDNSVFHKIIDFFLKEVVFVHCTMHGVNVNLQNTILLYILLSLLFFILVNISNARISLHTLDGKSECQEQTGIILYLIIIDYI